MTPRLTDKEILALNPAQFASVPEWDHVVADAQLRKALWWAIDIMEGALPNAAEYGRAGAGFLITVLKQRLEQMDIEPWEKSSSEKIDE